MAALCGFATLLNTPSVLATIPSNSFVRLLFQPAEETPGGALPMIAAGALADITEVYGWHNWPTAPVGTMLLIPGTIMAHDSDFTITITGRGGHASAPAASIDPVVCGAAIVLALQTVVSRTLPSSANAVLSVTMFHAGEATNVIPDTAVISGTIRDLSAATFQLIVATVEGIVTNTAAAHRCTGTVAYLEGYAETANHAINTEIVKNLAAQQPNPMTVSSDSLPLMGSEDFGYYLQSRPGCFFICGTYEAKRSRISAFTIPGEGLTIPGAGWSNGMQTGPRTNCLCHGTSYDFNDNVLPYVVSMFLKIVDDRLAEGSGFVGGFTDDGVEAKVE